MTLLRKLPLPLAGTALGVAGLGNLLATYHPILRPLMGVIAALILVALLLKALVLPKECKEALKHPLVASTMATAPMALMILSTYLPKGRLAQGLWILSLAVHGAYLLFFTYQFVVKEFKLSGVFPSWFIVYVGPAAASVTAPYHGFAAQGRWVFWGCLILYLPVFALVVRRTLSKPELPEAARPSLAIYAAPASLLLTAYMASFPQKNAALAWILLVASLLFWLFATGLLFRLLKLAFYPSYSAFTFPFVISALASKAFLGWQKMQGKSLPWLQNLNSLQIILATLLCLFTLWRYLDFLLRTAPSTPKK